MYVKKTTVKNPGGSVDTFRGAVLFGNELKNGCEVIRIIPPVPGKSTILKEIDESLTQIRDEKLVFHGRSKSDIIRSLQAYCQQGIPLPDVFNPNNSHLEGLTPFQIGVYRETCMIPQGETRSYSWLCTRLKKFNAGRAMGGAMKTNPYPLFIPCHRIVKKNGDLGGFMGTDDKNSWQLALKKALLDLETLYHQPDLFSKDVTSSISNVIVFTPKVRENHLPSDKKSTRVVSNAAV